MPCLHDVGTYVLSATINMCSYQFNLVKSRPSTYLYWYYKKPNAMRVELIPNRDERVRFNVQENKVDSLIYDDATFIKIR